MIETINSHNADFLYDENETLRPFRDQQLTPALLTQWYQVRSCDIEKRSRLVDHALQFAHIGMQNGVEVRVFFNSYFFNMRCLPLVI